MLLNHDADNDSGDEGCYSSKTVNFAANAMTITQTKPASAPTCGNGNGATQAAHPYLSGSVISKNSFTPGSCAGNASCISCPSGTCTIQAKIRTARGWPAFWLLGGNGLLSTSTGCQYTSVYSSWNNEGHCNWNQDSGASGDSAEIDIMEMNEQGGYTGSTQNLFSNGTSNQASVSGLSDATLNYHLWTLHWSPSSLTYAQDGTASSAHWTSNVPQNPMFIIIENTVGVGTGAQPPNSVWPSTMTTQYVQVCDGTSCTSPGTSGGNSVFFDNFAFPATYYVNASTGSDSNTCTLITSPCLTIGHAISLATVPGSTVQVAAGSYTENLTISNSGTSGSPITIRGQDGSGCPTTPVVDVNHPTGLRPNSSVILNGNATFNAVSWVNFDCFFLNGASAGIDIVATSSNLQITNNVIKGTTALGTNATGIFIAGAGTIQSTLYSNNITIAYNFITQSTGIFAACSNCNFHDNEEFYLLGGEPTPGNDHDYFDMFGANTVIRHNYLHGNTINGCDTYDCHMDCIQTWDNAGDGTEIAQNITFDRNVCFNHHEGVIAQDNANTGQVANWTVTNNVFAYGPYDDGSGHPGPAGTVHSWCWVFENGNQGTSNFFFNNTCIDGAEGFRSNAGSAVYKDNLFYSLGTDVTMYDNSGATVTGANNLYYAVSASFSSGTFPGDIINQDPKIVSAGTGSGSMQCIGCNFNIQGVSHAINVGVNTSPTVTTDLLGTTRPQGPAYDIGAYEFIFTNPYAGSQLSGVQVTPGVKIQ